MWTDKQIKGIKPKEKRYLIVEPSKTRGGGRLALMVTPDGKKTFYYQFFEYGSKKLMAIGEYTREPTIKEQENDLPISKKYTLSDARAKKDYFAGLIEKVCKAGETLKECIGRIYNEDLAKEEAKRRTGTFNQLLDTYIQEMEREGKRSVYHVQKSLDRHVINAFPDLMKMKASDIETSHIGAIISKMKEQGITTHCNRVRSYLSAAFNKGMKYDNQPERYTNKDRIIFNIESNPIEGKLERDSTAEKPSNHVIEEKEIPIIWNGLKETNFIASKVINLALATGQRTGELVKLKLSDVDLDKRMFTIPESVSKNKIAHDVYINDLALKEIEELIEHTGEQEYLFPGTVSKKYKGFINSTTVAKAVNKFCGDSEDVNKFIPRDTRRTFKTLTGRAGIAKDVRDHIQNHAIKDVSSIHYDRHTYWPQKVAGLKDWNSHLALILKPVDNVTTIKRA